jgi:hypothetical protein
MVDDGWAMKILTLRKQAQHFAAAVPDGHFRDALKRRDDDCRHGHASCLALARSDSSALKRVAKSRCASTAGRGSISNVSRVMPRG